MSTWLNDFVTPFGGAVSIVPGTDEDGDGVGGDYVDLGDTDGQVFGLVLIGEAAGNPTSYSVAAKLQEADATNGTGLQDMAGRGYQTAALENAVPGTNNKSTLKLQSPNRTKRYARLHVKAEFTGGSDPEVPIAGFIFAVKRHYG